MMEETPVLAERITYRPVSMARSWDWTVRDPLGQYGRFLHH